MTSILQIRQSPGISCQNLRFILLVGLFFSVHLTSAQVNISGKPGLINIPTARILNEGTFHIGYHYNPSHYDLRVNNPNIDPDTLKMRSSSIYYLHLAMIPRLEININLLNVNGYLPLNERGIGDRQFDIKYAVLIEKERRPAVALILSAPFGYNNSLTTYAAVATKNFTVNDQLSAEISLGFGSPVYIDRNGLQNIAVANNFDIFSNYRVNNKNKRPNPYLSGPFGGVVVRYKKNVGGMIEWDSQRINIGAYATLFNHWTVQAGVINFDQVTVGTSYALSLLKLPKQLRSKQTKEN